MLTHDQLKTTMLSSRAVRKEYDRLDEEFVLIEQLIKARLRAGLSQAQVARRMGTQAPAICRIESIDSKHSPSIRTLQRYAAAVGCDLELSLRPSKTKDKKK
jgi:transcriptional regulator with XRE-family HTH domain